MFEKKYRESTWTRLQARIACAFSVAFVPNSAIVSALFGYTHSWNSRGRHLGYGRNACRASCSSLPTLCNWIHAVEKNCIHSNSEFVLDDLSSTKRWEYRARYFSKQTVSRYKINYPLTIISKSSGNVLILTEEFHLFETTRKSRLQRSNNFSSIFGWNF